jgi:hypothetical protein
MTRPPDERVVLSLEDKRRRGLFRKWTVLEEPVAVHSLMYYSRLVVPAGTAWRARAPSSASRAPTAATAR